MSEIDYASYCRDFATYFVAKQGSSESIAFPENLESDELDYSLESLKAVDNYLAHVRRHRDHVDDQDAINTIVWGGCYIGEVIRRNSKRALHWENYESYVARNPKLRELVGYGPGTAVLLVDDRGAMTMPLNKVGRSIHEGPENNIHFYAFGELEQGSEQS